MLFLLRLGQYIARSREPKDFWQQLLKGLGPNHLDIPFAILYSAGGDINEELSVSSEQSFDHTNWVLEGSVRLQDSSAIPRRLPSVHDLENFLPDFLKYIKSDYPTQLRTSDNTLPESLGRDRRTEFEDDVCETAIFLPIRSTGDKILGFLILGVNPRKRYDDDYRLFIELLGRQLSTSLATAVLFEDETRRAHIAAEQATTDRNVLSKQLAIQAHEVTAIESRFRRMADMAPVGMFQMAPDGSIIYANQQWYDLTQHDRHNTDAMVIFLFYLRFLC
jgi:PAS domain-containing protein